MTRRSLIALLAWLSLCFLVALFAASVTDPGAWYEQLDKPAWTPPEWVFPPVWTLLYTLMGVAAWMVWEHRGRSPVTGALGLFVVQLLLNGAWSLLFFGQHAIVAALVDILLLWAALLATVIAFLRIRPAAGILLLPYLAWVSYAAALNAAIVVLNA